MSAGMLGVAEARARVLADIRPVAAEWIPLDSALDRVLAAPLAARRSQPASDVSSMDGYAVRSADTQDAGHALRVVGENRAGAPAVERIGPGEAARIFTGAVMPGGADAVAIEENATVEDGRVGFSRPSRAGEFIRPAGLDFTAGRELLPAGTVLGPRKLGLAAAMGHLWLPVRRRPRVALLSTGDELVRPGEPAGPAQVVSTNATTLGGLVRRWGGEPVDLGIVPDSLDATVAAFSAAERVDIVVTLGGASIGAHDQIRPALAQAGLQLDFWRLAMRPGKPMLFGRLGGVPVLGLPGNAVSATVCAMLFLRAALLAMLGLDPALPLVEARTAQDLPANDEREDHVRARLVTSDEAGLWLAAERRQDSSMLAVLASADALILRAPRATGIAAGAPVRAILLDEAERLPGAAASS